MKEIRFRFFALLTVALVAGSAYSQANLDATTKRKRLDAIFDHLLKKKAFPAADRDFVLSLVDSPRIGDQYLSTFDLVVAAQEHLFPLKRALNIVENKAGTASRTGVSFFIYQYGRALGISMPAGPKKEMREGSKLLFNQVSDCRFDGREQQFITHCLSNPDFKVEDLAAELLLTKRNLDKDSYKWGLARIAEVRGKARRVELQFWQFVGRTYVVRNPKIGLSSVRVS